MTRTTSRQKEDVCSVNKISIFVDIRAVDATWRHLISRKVDISADMKDFCIEVSRVVIVTSLFLTHIHSSFTMNVCQNEIPSPRYVVSVTEHSYKSLHVAVISRILDIRASEPSFGPQGLIYITTFVWKNPSCLTLYQFFLI